jgi:hypothetical protein
MDSEFPKEMLRFLPKQAIQPILEQKDLSKFVVSLLMNYSKKIRDFK